MKPREHVRFGCAAEQAASALGVTRWRCWTLVATSRLAEARRARARAAPFPAPFTRANNNNTTNNN